MTHSSSSGKRHSCASNGCEEGWGPRKVQTHEADKRSSELCELLLIDFGTLFPLEPSQPCAHHTACVRQIVTDSKVDCAIATTMRHRYDESREETCRERNLPMREGTTPSGMLIPRPREILPEGSSGLPILLGSWGVRLSVTEYSIWTG